MREEGVEVARVCPKISGCSDGCHVLATELLAFHDLVVELLIKGVSL